MGTHFNIESQLLIQNICNEFKNTQCIKIMKLILMYTIYGQAVL